MMFEGGFGADGVEVDEPGLEQRLRHLLQRLVHAPVQLDLVVQRPQDVRDGALFGHIHRRMYIERFDHALSQSIPCSARSCP